MMVLAMLPAGRLAVPAWDTPTPVARNGQPDDLDMPDAVSDRAPAASSEQDTTRKPASRRQPLLVHPALDVWDGNGHTTRLVDVGRPAHDLGYALPTGAVTQAPRPPILWSVTTSLATVGLQVPSWWGSIYPHAPPAHG